MPHRRIEDPATLRRLLEAVLHLEADLSLPVLLEHFVQEACSMTGARYGALGVLNEDRTGLSEFITVGMSGEEERAIGVRPTGLGVLGLLIVDPKALRIRNISEHPQSAGFPANHPEMRSFLGVPVGAHNEVYGNLYLTEKIGWEEFTQDDEELVGAFAQAAGIAIENTRLQERVRQVAVLEDRDRIARDLHDAVIQRLFAVGLSLQGVARPLLAGETLERVQRAIGDLDDTIRQIRSSIFELAGTSTTRTGVRAGVLALVRELRPVVGFDVAVFFEGPVETSVPDFVTDHLLFTIREALTNVGRHAQASRAEVRLRVDESTLSLEVVDDGRGIATAPDGQGTGGLGLANLRRRAEKLGGELSVEARDSGGTSIVWRVPL
ncbi:MAG TPA: GAF domain-containing sensor histidine kinase [Acidimicrobiales bacterium]|nr:GAF domain-containing sensor histidine kinase [Acidimicrobiales bacterium]